MAEPEAPPAMSQMVALGDEAPLTGEVNVTPLEIVEDSRCPTFALCVQAGRLVVKVAIEHGGTVRQQTMELGSIALVPGGVVQFARASDRGAQDAPLSTSDYLFGFSYVPNTAF